MMLNSRAAFGVVIKAAVIASLVLIAALALAQPALAQPGPVVFPPGDWPWYAQEEIVVHPEPPVKGQLAELCATVINEDPVDAHPVTLAFGIAEFGIGMPFEPVGQVELEVPPGGEATGCVVWVPPEPGHWCVEVLLTQPGVPEPQRSLRNVDLDEPLVPGEPHTLFFPVRNPLAEAATIDLGLVPHLPGWDPVLSETVLSGMESGEVREVSLTVTPPTGQPLPTGLSPIVDVEALVDTELIGGFRKIHRPPILLHRFPDPPYAEREISVHPYPPLAGEPVEICVELRNPTPFPHDVEVQFSWANFGIGLPFTPINGLRPVHLPPHSVVNECIWWVPPMDGHLCLQVELIIDGYEAQRSQRNIDVDEPLEPGQPHELIFPVGNPLDHPVDIELNLIPHLDGWDLVLVPDLLLAMAPGEVRDVSLTVTPPEGVPLPEDGTPIVDVEAFAEGELIGGFRKIFRPPVPVHRPGEPTYGESELSIEPYPPRAGEPVAICTRIRNYADVDQTVQVEFSAAGFGIGIPFMPIAPPMMVEVPANSEREVCVNYVFSYGGQFCVQVRIQAGEYPEVFSQRNFDVIEILVPGEPDHFQVPVGNPFDVPVDITLGLINHTGWDVSISPDFIPNAPPWPEPPTPVSIWLTPTAGLAELPEGAPVIDLEAYANNELIGGIRKVFRPPIQLHPFPDPPYAEREISVHPYPPLAGEPTEICVELRNPTPTPWDVAVQFSWASFGIGIPFTPINGPRPVHLPPHSVVNECIHWIPPVSGHVCLQVELFIDGYEPQRSQRNIDVDEPLEPGQAHELIFPVGNPLDHVATIELGLVPHLEGWGLELAPPVLPDMDPGEVRDVSLAVTPPDGEPLPQDGQLIVDVEAFAEGELIGGFRKIHRPPIQLHPFPDPPYAEREITVHPYPPRAGEPTEICVELRNPTPFPHDVQVQFFWANFGIGLPFTPINGLRPVQLPPYSLVHECIWWIPPMTGHVCLQVELSMAGYVPQRSQLNVDVDEPLEPGQSHELIFPVGNRATEPVTITLGLVPHLDGWDPELSPDVLPNVQPGEALDVALTVTPPDGEPLPEDGHPIVDVEAFVEGELIGGFRKIYRPPVPIHRPKDPIYAESEIGVDPYPVLPGQPVKLSVEVFNPTDQDRIVTAHFSIAPFGIGLPFSAANIMPNPIQIFVPRHGAARGHVIWEPPDFGGKFCVRVELQMEGHESIWSQRNIDVGEPLEPGQPHDLVFPVGTWPHTEPVSITLGLINHRDGWVVSLSDDTLTNVQPDQPVDVTLTVSPTGDAILGTGEPIVDVEAYVEGELLGGFRKLDIPPIPLHKPHEKVYAETELSIEPDPPRLGQEAKVSAVLQNNGPTLSEATVEFGWAKFGVGIPFTTTGMVPYTRTVQAAPGVTVTASATWTPVFSGSHCVMVKLIDPDGDYEDLVSQRNVDVVERPACGEELTHSFAVYNDQTSAVTVKIGVITFDVPPDWIVSTEPSATLELGPLSEGTISVTVNIPCPITRQTMLAHRELAALQEAAGSVPIIDVEGYVDGELVGGIELQFPLRELYLYLPLVFKK
jgi:hypothetical protein